MASVDNEQALATFERNPPYVSSERLRAARFLARHATSVHRERLTTIRRAERNFWVRQALDQALKRSDIDRPVVSTVAEEEVPETPFQDASLYAELRAQAIEETTALFLHELRPLVGLLDGTAESEIRRYECSRTKIAIDRVRSFLGAIESLRKASAAPAIEEFDLTDLVIRLAADEALHGRVTLDNVGGGADEGAGLDDHAEETQKRPAIVLSLGRRDSVVTTGDPNLIALAAANALRNAIEATLEVGDTCRKEVVLHWGATDRDSWIVVLDEGCGLPSGWEHLNEPGVSTKSKSEGHLGMGLPMAHSAIESIRGSFQLTPRADGGVSCEIRWPQRG